MARDVGDFPHPVRTAQTEMTGLDERNMVEDAETSTKSAPWALAMAALVVFLWAADARVRNREHRRPHGPQG